jgi:hypothetical protein
MYYYVYLDIHCIYTNNCVVEVGVWASILIIGVMSGNICMYMQYSRYNTVSSRYTPDFQTRII